MNTVMSCRRERVGPDEIIRQVMDVVPEKVLSQSQRNAALNSLPSWLSSACIFVSALALLFGLYGAAIEISKVFSDYFKQDIGVLGLLACLVLFFAGICAKKGFDGCVGSKGGACFEVKRADVMALIVKAKEHDVVSLKTLASYLSRGCWFIPDQKLALALYLAAAELGDHEATMEVSNAYRYGYGVEANAQMEYEWLLRAKEQNSLAAFKRLGEIETPERSHVAMCTGFLLGMLLASSANQA